MNGIYYNRFTKSNFILNKWNTLVRNNRFTLFISVCIITIMILSLSIISTKVDAEKSLYREKLITSVKVEKGDSLWSIASEYITDEYDDMESYINEIKKSNGLSSEVIHAGSYIIVPYYKTTK